MANGIQQMLSTIHTAAQEIRQGRLTPLDLLDTCLERIDRYEPTIQAWVFVDRAGARAEAEHLTAEARRSQWRGPFPGVPPRAQATFSPPQSATPPGAPVLAAHI